MSDENFGKDNKTEGLNTQSAYLGIIAETASANPPSVEAKNRDANTVRKLDSIIRRMALQKKAKNLLKGHRIKVCLEKVIPLREHVDIVRHKEKKTLGYRGLQRCGMLWACPVCASKITEGRAGEIQEGVKNWHTQDGFVIFATYTMSHGAGATLNDSLDILKRSLKRFKSGRAYQELTDEYGIQGTIKALEITYGDNGWHPHIHELIFVLPLSQRAIGRFIQDMRERWIISLRKEGGDGKPDIAYQAKTANQDIYDYIAKYGKSPTGEGWSIEREITKSPSKLARKEGKTPFQLLDESDTSEKSANLFIEYVHTMHGVRQLVWSKGLREKLGLEDEIEDEKIAGEGEDNSEYELLAQIDKYAWYYVLNAWRYNADVRGDMLKVFEAGGVEALRDFIESSYNKKIIGNQGKREG